MTTIGSDRHISAFDFSITMQTVRMRSVLWTMAWKFRAMHWRSHSGWHPCRVCPDFTPTLTGITMMSASCAFS
ncbi:hypothetical protein N234_35835 [Ralstonia pickettii DTP0602]|nr:hypothetical protein N234_35835 [Ralstonia pickettii DTP0602]